MSTKEYTTPVFVIRIDDDEAEYMLMRATRVVVTIKGKNRTYTKEGEDVVVNKDKIIFSLTQGESGQLGTGKLNLEVTVAFPDGAVLKTKTLQAYLSEAVRRKTT